MTEQEVQEHVDLTTSQLAELPDGQISGIVHHTNLTSAGPKRSTVQEVEAPASSSDALQPESPLQDPADASEAEDVPLLTNIATSEASSESQTQSESSIPHTSQPQLHSTAQRSPSTTTSQASDTESNVAASLVSPASTTQRSQSMATSQMSQSDSGVGSNLVSAPSIGVQSEQASDGATEATDEDRMSSHAAASTSGVAPQETPNSRPTTAHMQGECRQQFQLRQLMCKICLLHGS